MLVVWGPHFQKHEFGITLATQCQIQQVGNEKKKKLKLNTLIPAQRGLQFLNVFHNAQSMEQKQLIQIGVITKTCLVVKFWGVLAIKNKQ